MSANADERLNEPSAEGCVRRKPRRAKYGCLAVGCVLVLCAAVGLWRAIDWARKEAIHAQSQCPLAQLALAFHNYHQAHGCFPPAYLVGDDGTPMHSWRVLILPYVEREDLYREYDFQEPWNGPNNIRLDDRMPTIYHCPSEPESDSMANFVVIVGEDTAFPFGEPTSVEDFEDGLGNTILLAEIADSDIPWLEPRDLAVGQMSYSLNDDELPSISSSRRQGPLVGTADGTTYALNERLRPDTIKAFTTIAGHEELAIVEYRREGLESFADGPVTDEMLNHFDRWEQVRRVWLTRSRISDAGTSRLPEAQRLYDLNLDGTQVTDATLEHLEGLPNLGSVDLRDTSVTIPGVVKLALSARSVGIRFSFGCIANRQVLDLDLSNGPLTDEDLRLPETIAIPANVNLSGTAISGASLRHLGPLTDLRLLNLADTQIADEDLEYVAKFTRLQELNLSGTRVTDKGLEHLKALTNLHALVLHNAEVTDAGLEHLEGLTTLQQLELDGTQVTNAGLQHLKGLTSLTELVLSSTQVTDDGLEHLEGLTTLDRLKLDSTQVTDDGLEHLKGLTSLTYLFLSSTQVTDEGIQKLKGALPNCYIEH